MGKIFVIIGKSASGKDQIYKELKNNSSLKVEPLVLYTTRPMRSGERNGREYYFTDIEHMNALRAEQKIIEERVYETVFGDWYYFTADEGQIDPARSYLGIGTLESFVKLQTYFGAGRVLPIYIECEDRTRLLRAVERESIQKEPAYKEVCRRYLADEEDFSEEKIKDAGISVRFDNSGRIEKCIQKIEQYMKSAIG